jgi:hypothetical protein
MLPRFRHLMLDMSGGNQQPDHGTRTQAKSER